MRIANFRIAQPCSALWFAVGLCIATTGSLVGSQAIETIPPKLYAKNLAQNVNLLCRADKPIEACTVKIPGYLQVYDVHNLNATGLLSYYGDGLPRGDCGVTIGTFKAANEGKFQCNLTVGGEVYSETIELTQALVPEATVLEIGENTVLEEDGFTANQTLSVKCISADGIPGANLSWYLNDDPIDDSMLGEITTSTRMNKKGKTLTTVEQELKYFITPEDNGKKIVCKAKHFANGKVFSRGTLPLDIKFAPLPHTAIYIDEKHRALINITVRANPRPKTSWKVHGEIIEEGQSVGPYQAYSPRDMDCGNYLVLLKVNERTNDTMYLEMTATNSLGSQTYVIKASKFRAEDNETEEKSERNGAVFWAISLWTFFCSVIISCLL